MRSAGRAEVPLKVDVAYNLRSRSPVDPNCQLPRILFAYEASGRLPDCQRKKGSPADRSRGDRDRPDPVPFLRDAREVEGGERNPRTARLGLSQSVLPASRCTDADTG